MKIYISPKIELIRYDTEHIIATSLTISEDSEDNIIAGAPKRREWGNLWK